MGKIKKYFDFYPNPNRTVRAWSLRAAEPPLINAEPPRSDTEQKPGLYSKEFLSVLINGHGLLFLVASQQNNST